MPKPTRSISITVPMQATDTVTAITHMLTADAETMLVSLFPAPTDTPLPRGMPRPTQPTMCLLSWPAMVSHPLTTVTDWSTLPTLVSALTTREKRSHAKTQKCLCRQKSYVFTLLNLTLAK